MKVTCGTIATEKTEVAKIRQVDASKIGREISKVASWHQTIASGRDLVTLQHFCLSKSWKSINKSIFRNEKMRWGAYVISGQDVEMQYKHTWIKSWLHSQSHLRYTVPLIVLEMRQSERAMNFRIWPVLSPKAECTRCGTHYLSAVSLHDSETDYPSRGWAKPFKSLHWGIKFVKYKKSEAHSRGSWILNDSAGKHEIQSRTPEQ